MVDTIEVETVSIEMDGATKEVEVKKPKKKAVEVEVVKKPQTCKIEQALPVSVIQLVVAAPHNDTVRAVILAHLKIPVPDECKTYPDIKEWIETTIVRETPKKKGAPPTPPVDEGFAEIPISGSDVEHGRCSYSIHRSGRGPYKLSVVRFRRLVEEAEDMDDLITSLSERINDDWDQHITLSQNDGGYDHNDYEADDDDNGYTDREWDYLDGHRENIRRLIAQHAPDRLGLFNDE